MSRKVVLAIWEVWTEYGRVSDKGECSGKEGLVVVKEGLETKEGGIGISEGECSIPLQEWENKGLNLQVYYRSSFA